jgi:hypothetical protein
MKAKLPESFKTKEYLTENKRDEYWSRWKRKIVQLPKQRPEKTFSQKQTVSK